MDFDQALAALRQRIPHGIEPDLQRITALSDLLANPQQAYPSIHITGTNGKTSVARMITTLCSSVGLTAGTYTSPHLQSVRERLSVAGRPIGEEDFAEAYEGMAPLMNIVDSGRDDAITYFEALTAMAYWWFADFPVEVGVFEVGMGGEWDATNLVRGEVAVLTAIDVDHRELGGTPEEVAREKVGIIKEGATVVTVDQEPAVMSVIEDKVAEMGATLLVAGDDFGVLDRKIALGGQILTLRSQARTVPEVMVPLYGGHQAENAAIALAAFDAFLRDGAGNVDDEVVREAFAATTSPGRLEVVHRAPTVILDGAHNPHGARTAALAVGESFNFRTLILVIACLADKDIRGIVEAYRDLAKHVVVTAAPSERGASADEMAAVAEQVWQGTGVAVEVAADVGEALDKATGVAGEGDGVLVTGSLYTVGAARDRYLPLEDPTAVFHEIPDEDEGIVDDPIGELEYFGSDDDEFLGFTDDED